MLPLQHVQKERRALVQPGGAANLIVGNLQDRTLMLSFEEYEELMPTPEELEPYGPDHPTQKEPVIYWNPIDPGCYIKPWPQIAAIHDGGGRIVCTCLAEENAWRAKLSPYCGGNPDRWKGNTGDFEFECETCHFRTFNAIAWTDHIRWWKHK